MDLYTYEQLVKSESASRRYLLGFCLKNKQRICPECGSRSFWKLGDSRRRCTRCRESYTDLTGRWLEQCRLSCGQWLRLVKLFELELSARKMAQQLGLSYNTLYAALTTIRCAILAHADEAESYDLDGEVELDESYFVGKRKGKRGRGAVGKVSVFGVLERNGRVCVEVVPNVRAETLLGLTVKKVRRGSIVYTDHFNSYYSLICCGYRRLSVDHASKFSEGRVYINGLEGFWNYAKERLMKHHGISPQRFPLYLKELEFRYNHRNQDIFPIIAQYLCDVRSKT